MNGSQDELMARVAELELRHLESERLLEELNAVVFEQAQTLERVQAEMEQLRKKISEPGVVDARERERPPHY